MPPELPSHSCAWLESHFSLQIFCLSGYALRGMVFRVVVKWESHEAGEMAREGVGKNSEGISREV